MAATVVPFPEVPWAAGGHPLERKKAAPAGGATLLEFLPAFRDPNWCANGHAGLVLDGTLGFELDGGGEIRAAAGEGFVIDAGTRHRAFNPGPGPVRLFVAPRG